jgi:hypothetical protein
MRTPAIAVLTVAVATFGGYVPLYGQHWQKNVLTAEEIGKQGDNITTAYEAVARLRPMWLHPSDITMQSVGTVGQSVQVAPVKVYLNDFNVGDVDYLKAIPAENVQEMRFLSQNETASRYGPTDGQVAIVVKLKKPQR